MKIVIYYSLSIFRLLWWGIHILSLSYNFDNSDLEIKLSYDKLIHVQEMITKN